MPSTNLPTGSRVQRAMECAPSAVLPRVEHRQDAARKGTGVHAFVASLQTLDRDGALALVPKEHREACEAIDVTALPLGGEFLAEASLAYDVETEVVRFLGCNIGREYGPLGPNEIALTLDTVGLGDSLAFVADIKTGRSYVPPAYRNWQLLLGALAVCRWKGLSAARVALIHLREGEELVWDCHELDAFDLASAAVDLRDMVTRIREAERAVAQGQTPAVVTGPHCRYCPSFTGCPAQTALIRQLGDEPGKLAHDVKALLAPETAAKAYHRLRVIKEAVKAIDAAIYGYAQEHPIDLGDGMEFGPVEKHVESIDAGVARAELAKLHGPEVAEKACDFETSKAGIERALRSVYETRKAAGEKVTIKALKEEALAAVRDAGGVVEKPRTETREHKKVSEG